MLLRACLAALVTGLVASAAAAERAPVARANPCAAHGPGFQPVEGTGTCVKLGGSVRAEADIRSGRSRSGDRARLGAEARAALDARTETGAGPLRAVVQVRGRRAEPAR